jgi:hypothetical protein
MLSGFGLREIASRLTNDARTFTRPPREIASISLNSTLDTHQTGITVGKSFPMKHISFNIPRT